MKTKVKVTVHLSPLAGVIEDLQSKVWPQQNSRTIHVHLFKTCTHTNAEKQKKREGGGEYPYNLLFALITSEAAWPVSQLHLQLRACFADLQCTQTSCINNSGTTTWQHQP